MRFSSCIYTFIFSIYLLSCDTTLKIPAERKRTAIATVEDPDVFGMHGSSYTLYVYYINHQRYVYKAYVLSGVALGEKCLVEYDSLYLDRKHLKRDSSFFYLVKKQRSRLEL